MEFLKFRSMNVQYDFFLNNLKSNGTKDAAAVEIRSMRRNGYVQSYSVSADIGMLSAHFYKGQHVFAPSGLLKFQEIESFHHIFLT